MTAANGIYVATIVHGYREAACACILAQIQDILESEYWEMIWFMIEEDVHQPVGQCNRGEKGFEVSILRNNQPNSINLFYSHCKQRNKNNCFWLSILADVLQGYSIKNIPIFRSFLHACSHSQLSIVYTYLFFSYCRKL